MDPEHHAAEGPAGENAAGFGAASLDLDTDTPAGDDGAEPESPRAIELLDSARKSVSGELEAGRTAALFGAKQGRDDRFVRERDQLRTIGGDRDVEVALPVSARGSFTIREKTSGLAAHVRFESAADVPVAVAEGHAVYDSAVANGAHVVQRPIEGGIEDYVYFEQRPAKAEVRYVLDVSDGIAGLRLVSNTLELIDEQGTPRLRVSPPYLIDRRAKPIAARLDVEGCAYDENPAAPWDRAPTPAGANACTVVVSWDDDAVEYPAALDPAWTATGNMLYGRLNASATLLQNGRVLFAGGCSSNVSPGGAELYYCGSQLPAPAYAFYPAASELFDPTTTTFSVTGSLTSYWREHHAATLLSTGHVAVAGGVWRPDDQGTENTISSIERYNPTTGTWSAGGTLAAGRSRFAASLLPDARVLFTGGKGAAGNLATSELYTATTNSSVLGASLQQARSLHTATTLNDGRIFIVGGGSSGGTTYEIYSPSSSTFAAYTNAGAPVTTIANHGATKLLDGRVLIAGGWNSGSGGDFGATYIYDPTANTWSRQGSMAKGRMYFGLTTLANGEVLASGGGDWYSTPLYINPKDTAEIFTPAKGTWAPLPVLRDKRGRHHAVRLNDGRVLIAGGLNPEPDLQLRTAYTYDATLPAITAAEYRINPNTPSELWASLHRPTTLAGGQRYPLIVLVHGRSAPCTNGQDFTSPSGPCAAGSTEIAHHRGFDYLSEELARRGYFALSINWNRFYGATLQDDPPLPSPTILNNLFKLASWDSGNENTPASLGVNLTARFDFSQIAFVGHSRGGAAVIEAYTSNTWAPGWNVRGIFTIGAAESQIYSQRTNPANTKFVALIPMCDWDGGEDGVQPFDRLAFASETTPAFKATYVVHGAQHSFYNTLWQFAAGTPCSSGQPALFTSTDTGSVQQRQTAVTGLLYFVLGNVGPTQDPTLNQRFDPRYPLDAGPRVDRGYLDGATNSVSIKLEQFTSPTGTGSRGFANAASNVTVAHRDSCDTPPNHDMLNHESGNGCAPFSDDATRTHWAQLTWNNCPFGNCYFQSNWAASGSGVNLSSYQTLDLRIDRATSALNPSDTNFDVRLVKPDGTTSNAVQISQYVRLRGPFGTSYQNRSFLQTARIPLTAFTGVNLSSVRGVRLAFGTSSSGSVYVANIRASKPAP